MHAIRARCVFRLLVSAKCEEETISTSNSPSQSPGITSRMAQTIGVVRKLFQMSNLSVEDYSFEEVLTSKQSVPTSVKNDPLKVSAFHLELRFTWIRLGQPFREEQLKEEQSFTLIIKMFYCLVVSRLRNGEEGSSRQWEHPHPDQNIIASCSGRQREHESSDGC